MCRGLNSTALTVLTVLTVLTALTVLTVLTALTALTALTVLTYYCKGWATLEVFCTIKRNFMHGKYCDLACSKIFTILLFYATLLQPLFHIMTSEISLLNIICELATDSYITKILRSQNACIEHMLNMDCVASVPGITMIYNSTLHLVRT